MSEMLPVKFYVNSQDFDLLGCITSWDGILSEGPWRSDIIEQDWLPGAVYQQGVPKTYSFEVPLTFHTDQTDPQLADAIVALDTIKTWRGPLLTLERRVPVTKTTYRRQTASGVLVSDLAPKIESGRFTSVILVFQNISAVWTTV